MSIQAVSPASVQTPPPVSPQVQSEQANNQSLSAQVSQKAAKAAQTDTATISQQALQMVSDGDSAAQEAKESTAEKASEQMRGKQ